MSKIRHSVQRITLCFGYALVILATAGCVGYVDGSGSVDAYVPAPEINVFAGFGRGHFDHDAGRRGFESRSAAGHFGHGGRR